MLKLNMLKRKTLFLILGAEQEKEFLTKGIHWKRHLILFTLMKIKYVLFTHRIRRMKIFKMQFLVKIRF